MKKPLWIHIGIRKKMVIVSFSDNKQPSRTRNHYYKIVKFDKELNNYELKRIKSTLVQDSWW